MARRRRSRVRHYASRARHRVSKMTIPLAPVLGILGTPAVSNAIAAGMQGNFTGAITYARGLAGLGQSGAFDWSTFWANWTPMLAGILAHKAAGKLGINATLGRAKIPLLRI